LAPISWARERRIWRHDSSSNSASELRREFIEVTDQPAAGARRRPSARIRSPAARRSLPNTMNLAFRPQTGRDVYVEYNTISGAYEIDPDTAEQRIFSVSKPPEQTN
jgi:hypothetical protein